MLRVVIALVHTGSRLASGDCGTNNKVFVVPPIAGAASSEAAPVKRPRRFMVIVPPDRQSTRTGAVCHTGSIGAAKLVAHLFLDRVEQAGGKVNRHGANDEDQPRIGVGRRPA